MRNHTKPTVSTLRAVAVLCGGVALGVLPLAAPGSASAATGPHIKAVPNSVMVNTDTHLIGAGWPAHDTITLTECSQKAWVVPQSPCDTDNTVTVTTNGHGRFSTPFKVETCPAPTVPPGFAERCYIGVPAASGVDTVTLVGAVRITVTGP